MAMATACVLVRCEYVCAAKTPPDVERGHTLLAKTPVSTNMTCNRAPVVPHKLRHTWRVCVRASVSAWYV